MNLAQKLSRFIQITAQTQQKVQEQSGYTLAQLIFWPTFCLLVIIHCITNTSLIFLDVWWMSLVYFLRYLLYVVVLVKIFFLTGYTLKDMVLCALLAFAGGMSFLFTGHPALLELGLLIIFAKDMPPRKVLTVMTCLKALAVVLTVAFSCLGILTTLQYQNGSEGFYNTYGFCHRNVLGANMAFLCLSWFYLRFDKLCKWDLLLWLVLSIGTYLLALSRSSLIVMAVVMAGMYLARQMRDRILSLPHLRKIVCGFFLLLLLFSILTAILYNPNSGFWVLMDKFLSKRLRFANKCLTEYGLSVFGQNLPFVSSLEAQTSGTAKLILDNAYLRAILYYGVIPGCIFLLFYLRSLDLACYRKNVALIAALLIFTVYGLSERYMLDVYYNFPLFIAGICQISHASRRVKATQTTPFEFLFHLIFKNTP